MTELLLISLILDALNAKETGYGERMEHAANCHSRFSCYPPADCTCFIKNLRAYIDSPDGNR